MDSVYRNLKSGWA